MSEFVTYLVAVTEEDIAEGLADDCDRCAVALACQRTIHPFVRVYGSRCSIYGSYSNWLGEFKLPKQVSNWIKAFDRGEAGCKGFTFEVDVPKLEGLL